MIIFVSVATLLNSQSSSESHCKHARSERSAAAAEKNRLDLNRLQSAAIIFALVSVQDGRVFHHRPATASRLPGQAGSGPRSRTRLGAASARRHFNHGHLRRYFPFFFHFPTQVLTDHLVPFQNASTPTSTSGCRWRAKSAPLESPSTLRCAFVLVITPSSSDQHFYFAGRSRRRGVCSVTRPWPGVLSNG